MATESDETFGRTVARGMAWGLGFAIVSVPLTLGIQHVLRPKPPNPYAGLPDDELELLLEHRLRRHGLTAADLEEMED